MSIKVLSFHKGAYSCQVASANMTSKLAAQVTLSCDSGTL